MNTDSDRYARQFALEQAMQFGKYHAEQTIGDILDNAAKIAEFILKENTARNVSEK